MPPFFPMNNVRPMDYQQVWDANSRQNMMDDKQVSHFFEHLFKQDKPQ